MASAAARVKGFPCFFPGVFIKLVDDTSRRCSTSNFNSGNTVNVLTDYFSHFATSKVCLWLIDLRTIGDAFYFNDVLRFGERLDNYRRPGWGVFGEVG